MKKESNSVLGLKWELETRGGGTFLKIAHSERRMQLVSSGRRKPWRIIGTYCRPCALAFEMLIAAERRRVNGRRLMTDTRSEERSLAMDELSGLRLPPTQATCHQDTYSLCPATGYLWSSHH